MISASLSGESEGGKKANEVGGGCCLNASII